MREFVRIIGPDGKSIRNDLYNSPPDVASYTVFKKGDLICAKNGDTGQVELRGTDFATIIQKAINNLPDGDGRIRIRRGIYNANSKITLKTGVSIVGEGYGTVIKVSPTLAEQGAVPVFETPGGNYGTEIAYMRIVGVGGSVGNQPYGWHGHAYSYRNHIHHLWLENIQLEIGGAVDPSNSYENLIEGNVFVNCYNGVGLTGTEKQYGNIIVNNRFINCFYGIFGEYPYKTLISKNVMKVDGAGIKLYGSYNDIGENSITGNIIESLNECICLLEGSEWGHNKNIHISNNVLKGTNRGITISDNCEKVEVKSNLFVGGVYEVITYSCEKVTIESNLFVGGEYGVVTFGTSKHISIKNNTFIGQTEYGVGLAPDGNEDIIVIGNDFYDCVGGVLVNTGATVALRTKILRNAFYNVSTPVTDYGVDTEIRDNIGFATENEGSATIPSGQTSVTVNHGLAGTPTQIFLTGTHSEVKDAYVQNITATSFDIVVDNPVSADRIVYWRAIYRP